jgi:glucokinase
MKKKNLIGIEIGGTKLQIVRADENLQIAEKITLAVRRSQGASGIRLQIEDALASLRRQGQIDAVGIGFGGPVDRRNGKVLNSFQVEGWADFPICEWIAEITEAVSLLENDSNLAALAEGLLGAGRGSNPVFYTNLGTGVGGGLIVDGEIFHGRTTEAEIGHILVDDGGRTVEDVCSGIAIDERVRLSAAANPEGFLAGQCRHATGGEARFLKNGIERGDPASIAIVDEAAGRLAFALSHASRLFDPELIVLGGGLSLIGETWRGKVEKALKRLHRDMPLNPPGVALSTLGELVVPTGALLLASSS